jgi:beta-glucosidase
MKEIGLKAYRLSISWPRVIPAGTGAINPKGLEFYDKLIDELLANNIIPFITLFHWDYPYELYCRGGWLNPASSDWFADYTKVIVERLSDRVQNWMTLNEPQCFIGLGHYTGIHAPGDKLGLAQVLRASHNTLLAHGKAVQVIRTHSKSESHIGFAPVGGVHIPQTDSPADIAAARKAMFSTNDFAQESGNNAWWMDPVFFGKYPDDGCELFKGSLPEIGPEDMKIISQPLDFFGFNNYWGHITRAGKSGQPDQPDQPEPVEFPPGNPRNSFVWPITPEGLYWGPKFFYERYQKPIIITENGMANLDWVATDGKVHDPQRIDYTKRYLSQLQRAIAEGVPAKGYFHWSIMDNFEWAEGYKQRFGMIYVDYETQKRTLKDTACWYRDLIAANGDSRFLE